MMKSASRIIRILLAAAFTVSTCPAYALIFLTEENPPFNFTAAKKPAGAATEIVAEMAKRSGVSADIRFLDWSDAFRRAQTERDTCLYSTARLENREYLFQWIGPIAVNKWAVFGRADFAKPVKALGDLRLLKIGGVADDAKAEFLRSVAITNIKEVLRDEQNPARLFLKADDPNHIDLWVASYYAGIQTAQRVKAGAVKLVFVVREQPLWLACSPRTDKTAGKQLMDALAAMQKDGAIKRVADELEKSANIR